MAIVRVSFLAGDERREKVPADLLGTGRREGQSHLFVAGLVDGRMWILGLAFAAGEEYSDAALLSDPVRHLARVDPEREFAW